MAHETDMKDGRNLSVSLSFERTFLPPFRDILVIGQGCSLGANGVSRSMELLVPNGYVMHESQDDNVAGVIINKAILKRISPEKIFDILRSKVFPYISDTEIIKVDLGVTVRYDSFDVKAE